MVAAAKGGHAGRGGGQQLVQHTISQIIVEYLKGAALGDPRQFVSTLNSLTRILLLEAAARIAMWPSLGKWFMSSFEKAWQMHFRNLSPPQFTDIESKMLVLPAYIDHYIRENLDKAREDLGIRHRDLSSTVEIEKRIAEARTVILYTALRSFFIKLGIE